MSDMFAIFHDSVKAGDIKIHKIDCHNYTKRDPSATTTEWFTAPDMQTATETAQRLAKEHGMNYRDCKDCKPSVS